METTFTSASANKYLRKLSDQKDYLVRREDETSTYVLAMGEQEEPPIYDYAGTREKIAEIDATVRKLRHELHLFNAHTMLPDSDMTIDEALVVLAQLSGELYRLHSLRTNLPKARVQEGYRSARNIVEYRYANYDIAQAERDYQEVAERISDLQLKIDLVNQTKTFTVNI